MVDTIELYMELEGNGSYGKVFAAINDFAEEIDGKKLHKDKQYRSGHAKRYITGAFGEKYGMLEVAVVQYSGVAHMNRLVLKFKPAKVLAKDNIYALSGFTDYENAVNRLNAFLSALRGYLPDYNIPAAIFWRVSRIDYAYAFATPYHEAYITLLRKGCDNFTDDRFPSSVFISSKKNININFYDKTVQAGHAEQESHNIRLEVQCQKGYLRHLLRKNEWSLCNIYYLWDDKIADNIVKYELGKMVGNGDFYSLKEAGKILAGKRSKKKVEKLKTVMKISLNPQAKLSRIPELYSHWDDTVQPEYVRQRLLPEFNKLGVSPLAIPEVWQIDHLPNPWKLLNRHN